MGIKAIFVDFYGTIVYEDGEVIKKITEIICKSGQCNPKDVAKFWWQDFQKTYLNSYGESFELQRILEKKSLIHTLEKFNLSANVNELSNMLFDYWVKPPIFQDSKAFFNMCPLPIYIVSNIDNSDIMQAIKYHSLQPAGVFTSEDAKSYKPRKELFELALKTTGFKASEVIHIGDSLNSDVYGASNVGIRAILLNRFGKIIPDRIESITSMLEVFKFINE